jgi:hypothetical protein
MVVTSTNHNLGASCDILWYHSFSEGQFFADYLNKSAIINIELNHNMWHPQ